ncbi:hypothetical protein [Palleronia pelagia]|uniref:Uncharacterized protein n=1 Tax=Palleronia pelagia TaxID=387096 RepID=A0A1H8IBP7_9RHOB|nr:hypothetical protein [Palleronia pelagia]SEN65759.1 hypothetical protein SAMN04488011_105172 [Palleronia pelagia]
MNANAMLRFFLRKVLHIGVSKGIDRAYGAGKAKKDMTPEERRRHQAARKNANRSKQALKMMRKIGRFR